MSFRGFMATNIKLCMPKSRFDVANTLGKEKSLDLIDLGSSLLDEPISLGILPSGVLPLNAKDGDDGADMTFSPVNDHEGVQ